MARDLPERLDVLEVLGGERVDDEREAALAASAAGPEQTWFELGALDEAGEVVGRELRSARQRRGDHRLVHRGNDDEVERLRGDVHDEVGAEIAQRGQPVLRDRARDHCLAGEVGQTEAHQLGERADEDVGILDGEVGDLVVDPTDRAVDLVLEGVGHVAPGELADAGRGGGDRVRLELAGQHEVVTRRVEDDVVGELVEHRDGAIAGGPADDDDPRVGEVSGHLRFDSPDRPLLEDVGEEGIVADGHPLGGVLDPLHVVDRVPEMSRCARFADPADGDRVGLEGPAPDVILGRSGVAARADADEPEVVAAEGHEFVVVPLVALERHVDDGGVLVLWHRLSSNSGHLVIVVAFAARHQGLSGYRRPVTVHPSDAPPGRRSGPGPGSSGHRWRLRR
jgi:hypothetical protein